ncbi:MAG: MotA/TolQ/ExbB proton channel family protein [Candidatus Aureabacteria bacterium]|nr:MotA/TolQ/ExbB proton channel family protein [Candidatus Auribacterota bacterium]
MIDIIIKGGPVMIPILLGSVVGLAIVIERLWVFRRMRLNTFEFVQEVFRDLKNGDVKHALQLCEKYIAHPLAAVFRVGILRFNLSPDRLEKVLEQAGNNQVLKMERYLGALVAVVSIEPLLGFLGTITGLIRAFMSWEKAGADVTVSVLASGMYEAMITTAAGLIIAIPLYLCYTYFVSHIKYVANSLNNHCVQLVEIIAENQDRAKS